MTNAIDVVERKLLGAILHDNNHFRIAAQKLRSEDFSLDSHRRIWKRMDEMLEDGRGVDCLTLHVEHEKHAELSTIGGAGYLASLDADLPRFYRDIPQWVDIIADASIVRRLAAENARLAGELEKPDADAQTILAQHKTRLSELERSNSRKPATRMFEGALTFAGGSDPTTDWLVAEIVPRAGNGIMGGDPKASKSFGALDLSLAASCGASWMGHRIAKCVKVAVVSREDEPGLTRRRMKKLISGRQEYARLSDQWMLVNTRQQQADFQVTNVEHMNKLIDELGQFGAELVVLDVFRSLHTAEENDNTEVAKVLARISRIQTELKCATLLVHHIAKTENPNPFKGLRGASCIHGWMEFGLAVSVVNPESDRVDYVRRIQFESKECAVSDVHYRIIESADHAAVRLEQQTQWERKTQRRQETTSSILPHVERATERARADLQ